jgi:alpha/beta superfamily hydrolase
MTPIGVERIVVDGPSGNLEVIAENVGATAKHYAVVCHPHPQFGGTMDNKVVTTLVRAMHETGLATLRFNFRGVGGSAGTFDAGNGETTDADAVASWGAARWPGRQLVIAGFSFGAYVALRLAQRRPASQLVMVAPPVPRFDFSGLTLPNYPSLVVQGDADEVVDPQGVIAWVDGAKPRPRLVVMPGVGHFFHGRLRELREVVYVALRDAFRDSAHDAPSDAGREP